MPQGKSKSITKKQRDICERLEWSIHEHENGTVDLEKYSPAGEDFIFTVEAKDFAREVWEYAEDFDIDEHIMLFANGAGKNGTPSIRRLCEDAEDIQEMLDELACALTEDSRSTIAEIIKEAKNDD